MSIWTRARGGWHRDTQAPIPAAEQQFQGMVPLLPWTARQAARAWGEYGSSQIARERFRQVTEEGWTPAHDDSHTKGELLQAAHTYLTAAREVEVDLMPLPKPPDWPFGVEAWKPATRDPIPNLVKAGALIAAEIDRLERRRS